MKKAELTELIQKLFVSVPGNVLSAEDGIKKKYIGARMFDAPLIGFGSAADPLFAEYKKVGVIGPWHMSPAEWLPEARTVVSLFFPISEEIRESNRSGKSVASQQWAYARIEGQAYIASFMAKLSEELERAGIKTCVPSNDSRFEAVKAGKGITGYKEIDGHTFGSRWSERHAAYVCGLGSFGLSKGIITEKGMAGRFGSILIEAEITPDGRPYSGIYDHCIQCGACAKRCPVNAIDLIKGKDHNICLKNIVKSGVLRYPRYGCGLCQTGVPCEHTRPLHG